MCDKVRFMKRRFLAVAAISIPLMMLTEASTAFADQARPSAQFVLPNEVVSLANRYGVLVPERFQSTHNADIRGRLKQATEKHLTQSGHHLDPKATKIAREWANQAADGKVEFYGGSGKGNNHLDEGTGNIYRFDLTGAEEHIKWLGGTANYSPDGRPFGVATATKHSTIFLVEYFLN